MDDFNVEEIARKRKEEAENAQRAQDEEMQRDPELRAIYEETRRVQQDTLASTENSVRAIHDTIQAAERTSALVDTQGEQLSRIESKAEEADRNATDSYKSAKDIEKHSGWLPFSISGAFKGGKKKGEDRNLKSQLKTLDKQQAKLERISEDAAADQQTVTPEEAQAQMAKQQAAGESAGPTDAAEDAINANLDELSAGLDQIQRHAVGIQGKLEQQNVQMQRIDALEEHTQYTLDSADRKVKRKL